MMKGIFVFFAALLIPSSAYAASVVVPITIQSGAAGTTILPPPPNGFHWVQTFGDEFSTTFANAGTSTAPVTLDTSKWQVEHFCGSGNFTTYAPPTYGCAGPTTASDTVSGGLLTMTIQAGAPATRNIIDTAYTASPPNTNQPITPFQQRYGYFVYNAKLPTCSSNEFDLEGFGGTGPSGAVYGELGWVSQVNGGCHYGNLRAYQIDQNRNVQFFADVNLGDITTAFHQYGLLWTNDATAHGSVSVYVDGVLQTGPYALLSPAFDSGMYFDIYWNPCVGCEGSTGTDPQGSTMQFDWVRAYQLAPNQGGGGGAINLVNKGVNTLSASGTSVSVTIPSTGSHNAEVIGVLWCNDSGCGTASGDVVQSVKVGTQACTEVPGTFSSNIFDNSLVIIMLSVWECQNINAGQTTVTVSSPTPMWYIAGLASEWTCGATNCSIDTGLGNKAVTNSGTTLAISTNGPTTVTGDLIYSFATGIGTGSGLSTGNTPINILSTNNLDAYLIAGAPGVQTMNFGNSSAGISAVIAAFKP